MTGEITKSPEQAEKRGKKLYAAKEFAAAAEAFMEAAALYQAAGEEVLAAEMRNSASVAWVQAGQPERALDAVLGTPEVFAAAGDRRREGLAWGNLGSALEGLKRLKEAADAYKRAADLLAEVGAKEERSAVLVALSKVQLLLNDPVTSLITMQQAVDDQPRSLKKSLLKRILRAPFKLLGW